MSVSLQKTFALSFATYVLANRMECLNGKEAYCRGVVKDSDLRLSFVCSNDEVYTHGCRGVSSTFGAEKHEGKFLENCFKVDTIAAILNANRKSFSKTGEPCAFDVDSLKGWNTSFKFTHVEASSCENLQRAFNQDLKECIEERGNTRAIVMSMASIIGLSILSCLGCWLAIACATYPGLRSRP